MTAARASIAIVAALIAWGAMTFGAVYRWGFLPLAAGCALSGAEALTLPRVRAAVPRAIALALAAIVLAGLAQTIRLPAALLERLSPAALPLLAKYDLAVALGSATAHTLSIDPARTRLALELFVSFSLFLLGLTGLLDERTTGTLVGSVTVIGCVVASTGFAFANDHSGTVYGWWHPASPGAPFGPFVNRNHYAGWMLMATLLTFGHWCALLTGVSHPGGRSWRQRIIRLSTREGSAVLLVGIAAGTMALSVLVSMSRSGIVLLATGLFVLGGLRARECVTAWGRRAFVSGLVACAAAAIAWAGVDTLGTRFHTWRDDSLQGRLAIWRDTRDLVREFPLAGTGLNTFGVAMLFHQTTHQQEHYAEAHNDYLQLAAEGGVLVGVPVLVLLAAACRDARRRLRDTAARAPLRWIRAGAVAGVLAAAVQDAGDFSLQLPGNAALFCVLAAIALAPMRPMSRPS